MRPLLVSFLCCVLSVASLGQVKQRRTELNRLVSPPTRLSQDQQEKAAKVFLDIEKGLSEGSATAVSDVFDKTVHLALPGVEQAQFSRNQAAQLLAAFIRDAQDIEVKVKKKETGVASPYFSADLSMSKEGQQQQLGLYVSLIRSGDAWKIGHFSVY